MTNEKYMLLALDLAKSTLGQTSPNPVVGAVVVKNGHIVGTGAHLQSGMPHAEVYAIEMANDLAIGATLYTTLEPCCHHGKTGPCTQYIINKKIQKVIIATLDPNPKVMGMGVKALKKAGVSVEVGLLEEQALKINKFFFHFIKHRKPYVTIKAGMSLDGKLATSTFESKWITNVKARKDSHYYRHIHDAIIIGVNSVIKDNPSLTARTNFESIQPIRIILDTQLITPHNAQIVTDKKSHTLIITGNNINNFENKILKFDKNFVTILQMDSPKINLDSLLKILAKKNICSILVEGGSKVITSFIENNLFNELVLYISPTLIGGINTPSLFSGDGFPYLSEALNLKFDQIQQIDDNIKIVASKNASTITIQNEI